MAQAQWFKPRILLPWLLHRCLLRPWFLVILSTMLLITMVTDQVLHDRQEETIRPGEWMINQPAPDDNGSPHKKDEARLDKKLILPKMKPRLSQEQELMIHLLEDSYQNKINYLFSHITKLKEELSYTSNLKMIGNSSSTLFNDVVNGDKKLQQLPSHSSVSFANANVIEQNLELLKRICRIADPHAVISYDWSNGSHLLTTAPQLGSPNVISVHGKLQKDFSQVIHLCQENTAGQEEGHEISQHRIDHELLYRDIPQVGSQYEVVLHKNRDNGSSVKLILVRPYDSLRVQNTESGDMDSDFIHVILPLEKETTLLTNFLKYLKKSSIDSNGEIKFSIVYFSNSGINQIQKQLVRYGFPAESLVVVNEPYSRRRAINTAIDRYTGSGDIITLIADVDAALSVNMLRRCRLMTRRGGSVYYPLAFSLYDPHLIYEVIHQEKVPSQDALLRVNGDKGMWQIYRHSLSCQYQSDFKQVDRDIAEDVPSAEYDLSLYDGYAKKNYMVYRVPDPSLFYLWYERHCQPTEKKQHFMKCILSKSLSAGSSVHLGSLLFEKHINNTR